MRHLRQTSSDPKGKIKEDSGIFLTSHRLSSTATGIRHHFHQFLNSNYNLLNNSRGNFLKNNLDSLYLDSSNNKDDNKAQFLFQDLAEVYSTRLSIESILDIGRMPEKNKIRMIPDNKILVQ